MSTTTINAIAICSHTNINNGAETVRYGADFVGSKKRFEKNSIRNYWVELPSPVNTKLAALEYAKSHPDYQSPADQALLDEKIHSQLSKSTKGTKAVKAPKTAVAKSTKAKASKAKTVATETVAE